MHQDADGIPKQEERAPQDECHDGHSQKGIHPAPSGEVDDHHADHHGHIRQAVAKGMQIGAPEIQILLLARTQRGHEDSSRGQVE